jgi:hypothetical protein
MGSNRLEKKLRSYRQTHTLFKPTSVSVDGSRGRVRRVAPWRRSEAGDLPNKAFGESAAHRPGTRPGIAHTRGRSSARQRIIRDLPGTCEARHLLAANCTVRRRTWAQFFCGYSEFQSH